MDIDLPKIQKRSIQEMDIQYLHYEGRGSTIIFLHATGFLPWLWHPIARTFAQEYEIIAPYFCDHRQSLVAEGGVSWAQLANDLWAFINALDLKELYLVGHSMGATVLSIMCGLYPVSSQKLVLIEPIFLPEQFYPYKIKPEEHPMVVKAMRRRNKWESQVDARDYLKKKELFRHWDKEMLDLYLKYGFTENKHGDFELSCPPKKEASLFMGGLDYNPWPVLNKIKTPTLILEGENSENRTFIDLRKATQELVNGSYQLVQDVGHLIPMEEPQQVSEIIRGFFEF